MKLFPTDTFLVYRVNLVGDIFLLMYWDLDNRGRPECIGQFLRVGRSDPLPLKTPILLIRPPVIDGVYDKRELAHIIGEEVRRKRAYLDRIGQKLRRQAETLILTGSPFYKPKEEDPKRNSSEVFRRFLFLMEFLFGWDDGKDGEKEKKRPP